MGQDNHAFAISGGVGGSQQDFDSFLREGWRVRDAPTIAYSVNDPPYEFVGVVSLASRQRALCNHSYYRVAMPFQFFKREALREWHLGVNVRMTRKANDDEVILFVGTTLASWHDMVNL